jgi:hypothetical protein
VLRLCASVAPFSRVLREKCENLRFSHFRVTKPACGLRDCFRVTRPPTRKALYASLTHTHTLTHTLTQVCDRRRWVQPSYEYAKDQRVGAVRPYTHAPYYAFLLALPRPCKILSVGWRLPAVCRRRMMRAMDFTVRDTSRGVLDRARARCARAPPLRWLRAARAPRVHPLCARTPYYACRLALNAPLQQPLPSAGWRLRVPPDPAPLAHEHPPPPPPP